MLIVTGTGRSGTSFVAKWLYHCGKIDYEPNWIDNYNAGFEPQSVSRVNGAIFIGNDKELSLPEHILEFIEKIDLKLVKDPLFFYPNVINYWAKVKKDIKILVCLRNFEDVYKSRVYKGMNNAHPPEKLREFHTMFKATVSKLNIPTETIIFPEFLEQFDEVYEKIIRLEPAIELDYDLSKDIFERLADKSLVNFGYEKG